MIRLIFFLILVAVAALGLSWFIDRPGEISLVWQGYRYETSLFIGVLALVMAAIALSLAWSILRFILRLPAIVSITAQARRKNKGLEALSRGLMAVSTGEIGLAKTSALEARRHLGEAPMTLLLEAQAAQIAGNSDEAEAVFARMMERPETRLLALRGLHAAARQRGDADTALTYASQAHRIAPTSWAAHAVLDHHARRADWARALSSVEANLGHRLIDKAAANRQRAVLETAIALESEDKNQDEALRFARQAVKHAPNLVPAVVLLGRLLSQRGDYRKAAKMLEAGWVSAPHPDVADLYVNLRSGDSAEDRLARAKTLLKLAPDSIDGRLAVAGAAIDAREFAQAHEVLNPLLTYPVERPTRRVCLMMADLEETEHAGSGAAREWLARASRAPRDPAWIADGVISDTWAPISPVTGKLDAFVWQTPAERLSTPIEPNPIPVQPDLHKLPARGDTDLPQLDGAEIVQPLPLVESTPEATPTHEPQAHVEPAGNPDLLLGNPDLLPRKKVTAVAADTLAPPLKGLDPANLRHFTAPDDPGTEMERP